MFPNWPAIGAHAFTFAFSGTSATLSAVVTALFGAFIDVVQAMVGVGLSATVSRPTSWL